MRSRAHLIAFLLAALAASAAPTPPIVPEPLPDPHVAGFKFPESEATLTRWITTADRGSPVAAADAGVRLYQHAWGLWAALTAETSQYVGGQRLRVFETWLTPEELAMPAGPATLADIAPAHRGRAPLRLVHGASSPFDERAFDAAAAAAANATVPRPIGFVKLDPTAAEHVLRQELLHASALDALLAGGAQAIPPFPSTAIAVKPLFKIVHQGELIDGRYYALKVWPGPSDPPQPSNPDQWPDCIWLDLLGGGRGHGEVDTLAAADGSSRTGATTYPLASVIHYRLSFADATALNRVQPAAVPAAAGDFALLVAMHVSTRETARWTWQTFWWTPAPDAPPAPSSEAIAEARPRKIAGAAGHYAMACAYTMLSPEQPYIGGDNTTPAVYAYNPWIEARFGPADLPDSRAGFDPAGQPAANNVGVQTNCMSCHAQASYNPDRLATAPRFAGARYVDLVDPQFVGTLQTDFLWLIARHAR